MILWQLKLLQEEIGDIYIRVLLIHAKNKKYLSTKHVKTGFVNSLEMKEYSEGDEEGGQ